MQLIYAAASPFARKVRVLAAETGLLDRIARHCRTADHAQ